MKLWNSFLIWWRSRRLHSPYDVLRAEAVQRLPSAAPKQIVPKLLTALTDESGDVRAAAARRLAGTGDGRAIHPLIVQLLKEKESGARAAEAKALVSFDPQTWIPELTAALRSPDDAVRETASWALRTSAWSHLDDSVKGRVAVLRNDWLLAKQLGAAAVTPLKEILVHGTPISRREAADALGQIGDRDAFSAVISVLRDRRVDPNAREIAAWATRRFCWAWLEDEDLVRAAIVQGDWDAAAEVGAAAVGPLNASMKDARVEVRRSAAAALGKIGEKPARDALAAALVDQNQDAQVRAIAAEKLGEQGSEAVVSVLAAALADGDWSVRAAAAQSLEKLNWQPSRDWDRALFLIARQNIDEAAGVGSAAIQPLIDALRFPVVNVAAAKALVGLGLEGSNALVAASRAPDCEFAVREVASLALAAVGDDRAIQPLYAMLGDPDVGVRQSAVWSLERMGWQPTNDSERALAAMVHEDWATLRRLGVPAVDPIVGFAAEAELPEEGVATLEHILDASASRLSIDQLRRMVKVFSADNVWDLQMPAGGAVAAPAASRATKLAKLVKFELIRRGILW